MADFASTCANKQLQSAHPMAFFRALEACQSSLWCGEVAQWTVTAMDCNRWGKVDILIYFISFYDLLCISTCCVPCSTGLRTCIVGLKHTPHPYRSAILSLPHTLVGCLNPAEEIVVDCVLNKKIIKWNNAKFIWITKVYIDPWEGVHPQITGSKTENGIHEICNGIHDM